MEVSAWLFTLPQLLSGRFYSLPFLFYMHASIPSPDSSCLREMYDEMILLYSFPCSPVFLFLWLNSGDISPIINILHVYL